MIGSLSVLQIFSESDVLNNIDNYEIELEDPELVQDLQLFGFHWRTKDNKNTVETRIKKEYAVRNMAKSSGIKVMY